MSLAALALTCAALAPQELPQAAPRRGVEGIGGLQVVSRVRFEENPLADEEIPEHVLETVYAFPDRVRWRLHAKDADAMARELYFRFGESAWRLPERERSSVPYEDAERDAVILQMELRRATLHYPHGFAWESRSPTERVAIVRRSAPEDRPIVGRLVAEFEDDVLQRVRSFDRDGDEQDALEVLSTQVLEQQAWPRELRLFHGGRPVWTETITTLSTRAHYLDRFFQPPDRRTGSMTVVGGRQILQVALVPTTTRRRPLPEGTDWTQALALAATWTEEAAREHALDPVPTFELDGEARPRSVLLRLRTARADPPEGWETRWDRPGLGVLFGPLSDLDEPFLTLLRRTAPEDQRGGTPYCRVHDAPNRADVRVYLPLVRGE